MEILKIDCEEKKQAFKVAIEKYNTIAWYAKIETAFSIIIIALQILTSITLIQHHAIAINIIICIITIILAYLATDFVNGLVHMIMDNNTQYHSIVGPYIAAFHLHHAKIIYKNKHPVKIYFSETGHKFWLLFYLLILLIIQHTFNLNFYVNLFFVLIGIFSSLAELSHFWCHNGARNNKVIRFFQKNKILLSMDHHKFHHCHDNTHYAFLNGVTDHFLNVISAHFFCGYKNHADKHIDKYLK